MHVYRGIGLLHGIQDREIRLAGEARVDTPLQADFARAALPRLTNTARYFRQRKKIRSLATGVLARPLGKRAEGAVVTAYVGIVDIPVDHIAGDVTQLLSTDFVSGLTHEVEILTPRIEQLTDLREL